MSLQGCVASLASSCLTLNASLSTLDAGIHDFPRLIKVLQNTKHFELLPESDIVAARNDLHGEIEPQKEELLRRAERAVQAMERREYALKSRKELQSVRLQQRPRHVMSMESSNAATAAAADRAETLRVVKAKKERLAYTLKRLQMEEQGRKTRMSLAPASLLSEDKDSLGD